MHCRVMSLFQHLLVMTMLAVQKEQLVGCVCVCVSRQWLLNQMIFDLDLFGMIVHLDTVFVKLED